jgi:glucose/arabinose dehydrogenase
MQGGNRLLGPGGRKWQRIEGLHFHSENRCRAEHIAHRPARPGLVVYEGLLPEKYRGNLIHAKRASVSSTPICCHLTARATKIEDTVRRPTPGSGLSDVAVGPDGAVYIADWYDASVGGPR